MKKSVLYFKIAVILFVHVIFIGGLIEVGCSSSTTTTAVHSDALVITGVNAAMTTWANYVNQGKATVSQVNTVSNAYNIYWNAQIVASNAAYLYAQTPTTTASQTAATTLAAALASQSNIVAIVNQLTH